MAETFHEYRHVRQVPGEPRMRWFLNDYFELFVWTAEDDVPCAFRLCYDRGYEERAITWEKNKPRLRHDVIDDGETSRRYARAPVMAGIQTPFSPGVIARFAATTGEIPEEFRALVLSQLEAALKPA